MDTYLLTEIIAQQRTEELARPEVQWRAAAREAASAARRRGWREFAAAGLVSVARRLDREAGERATLIAR